MEVILVLLGDIGKPRSNIYRDFLTMASEAYKSVIVIMGNHEYYYKKKMDGRYFRSS